MIDVSGADSDAERTDADPDRGGGGLDSDDGSDRGDSFRTKTGRCHVDDQVVRLTHRPGRNLATIYEGLLQRGSIARRVALLALYLVFLSATVVIGTLVPWMGLVFAGLVLAAIAVSKYRTRKYGFTDDDEIRVEAIDSVVARRGNPLLTRPRFVVRYEDDGERKRRYVLLPSGLYAGTDEAYRRGKRLFEARGIEVREEDGPL